MPPLFLIMGLPAAGKSTVCRALMGRFPRGLHLPVDDLRHMVVSGLVDMGFEMSEELARQLRLAREAAACTALAYAEEGFAVAIDDFWHSDTPDAAYAPLLGAACQRVLLLPSVETNLARLHARSPEEGSFKVALAQAIGMVHGDIDRHPKMGWHVVDSSDLGVEATVDLILELTGRTP